MFRSLMSENLKGKSRNYLPICFFLFIACCILLNSPFVIAASWDPEAVLKTYLKNNYPWAEIELKDLTFNAELPAEEPEKIVIEKGPPAKTVFRLEFRNGKKLTVSAYVKASDWVVKSRRSFRKDHCFKEDDLFLTRMDVTKIPQGATKDIKLVVGKSLRHSIISNTPVLDTMINETPQIKKGWRVTLLAESPGFSITTTGEIRENGFIGKYVKVMNLSSKKILKGLLIDENTVKVDF
ncbi:MAG: flagellar basal body P-ring formation chaperone FlgA [Nitrospirota bacterium]